MSNGLCFMPNIGTVRFSALSALSIASSGTSEINQSLNEHTMVYRGACTVKDWSNSIVCLNEIYPEGKVSLCLSS